jgi:hypothetical protein
MPKEKKAASELIAMIEHRIEGCGFITIQRDEKLGWTARIVASPGQVIRLQAQVDAVSKELRELYDLAAEPVG